jgi:hypothetical protein
MCSTWRSRYGAGRQENDREVTLGVDHHAVEAPPTAAMLCVSGEQKRQEGGSGRVFGNSIVRILFKECNLV